MYSGKYFYLLNGTYVVKNILCIYKYLIGSRSEQSELIFVWFWFHQHPVKFFDLKSIFSKIRTKTEICLNQVVLKFSILIEYVIKIKAIPLKR